MTPSQTTSFPYIPALSSLPPRDTNEGQLWASRKAHLKKQLHQEMVSALSIAMNLPLRQHYCPRITHYVLRHCTLGVSKHLVPSKPNVLILLPSLLHLSLLFICLQLFCTLGATTFWEETTSLWLGKVSINYCGIEGKSIPRIIYRRLLHKPVQAATLNDLTGSLSFPFYYSTQHLN